MRACVLLVVLGNALHIFTEEVGRGAGQYAVVTHIGIVPEARVCIGVRGKEVLMINVKGRRTFIRQDRTRLILIFPAAALRVRLIVESR